jgi:hypothetical protein
MYQQEPGILIGPATLQYLIEMRGKRILVSVHYWGSEDEEGFGPQYIEYKAEEFILQQVGWAEKRLKSFDGRLYLRGLVCYKNPEMTRRYYERIKEHPFSTTFVLGANHFLLPNKPYDELYFYIPSIFEQHREFKGFDPAFIAEIRDDQEKLIFSAHVRCGACALSLELMVRGYKLEEKDWDKMDENEWEWTSELRGRQENSEELYQPWRFLWR